MRAARPGGAGRGLLAGLLSAGLHAAVLVLIWRAAEAPRRSTPVIVELVARGPAATTIAPPVPSPASRSPTATPTATATATATATPTPTPTSPQPPISPGAWFSQHGLAAERPGPSLPRAGPDLSPGPAPRGGRLARGAGPLAPLGERLAMTFAPGWDLIAGIGASLPPEKFTGAADRGYAGAARRFGATGSPFAGDPTAPGAADDIVSATSRAATAGHSIGETAEGLMAVQSGLLKGGAPPEPPRRLVTVVAVTQAADGAVTGASVESPSGSLLHDRLALGQAERLRGQQLPGPPGGGVTTWAFESDLARLPSWAYGCALEAKVRHGDCPLSLARLTTAHVTLLAVRPASP